MSNRCAGPCQQGRLPCPTPDACELSEQEASRLVGRTLWIAAALAAGILAVLVAVT